MKNGGAARFEKHMARLHGDLKLTPAQEAGWTEFSNKMKPVKMDQPGHHDWKHLSTPDRLDKMLDNMRSRDKKIAGHATAVRAFFGTLTPYQQEIFDRQFQAKHYRHGHYSHDKNSAMKVSPTFSILNQSWPGRCSSVTSKGTIMNTKQPYSSKALIFAILFAISLPASADEWHGGNGRHDGYRKGWHGNIRHFGRHDYHVWRSGGWRHVWHGGRLGWWWVVGGVWYFYPEPVYPYPNPYIPPLPAAPPPAQYWYFCASSNAYYPYVPTCADGWKAVPATPPTLSPSAPPGTPEQ
jgi:LTXXQ motif family protein